MPVGLILGLSSMINPRLPVIPTPTFKPPTSSFTGLQGPTNILATLLSRDGAECTDISRCRTTMNIVLSCLSTIFLCTWVALHLNVPKSNQSMWKSCWRKFGWMLLALIVPEYVAVRAIYQRLAAKQYMDEWNANFVPLCSPELVEIQGKTTTQYGLELQDKEYNSRWTLTHGFLARMGGIRLRRSGHSTEFIPAEKFFKDPEMRPIIQQIGLISSKDIEDKSKGDWMSKFFVVIQTTWFIVQCLARWATHLPVTELEAVTLAYAVLNIFIYVLWWDKPQNLSVPYCFYLEKDEEVSKHLEARGNNKQEGRLMRYFPSTTLVDEALNPNALPKSEIICGRCHRGRKSSLPPIEWVQPAYSGAQGFFMGTFDGDEGWFLLALAGAIFGGLHLIPIWLSVFPSNAEKILWRVSAFLITTAPAVVAPALFVLNTRNGNSILTKTLIPIAGMFGFCVMGVYAVARVILLVLTFTTLRSLPVELFLSVEWTRFIPHF